MARIRQASYLSPEGKRGWPMVAAYSHGLPRCADPRPAVGSPLCYQWFSGCAANGFPSMLPMVSGLCCQSGPLYVMDWDQERKERKEGGTRNKTEDKRNPGKARVPFSTKSRPNIAAYGEKDAGTHFGHSEPKIAPRDRLWAPMHSLVPSCAAHGFPSMLPMVFGLCCQWVPPMLPMVSGLCCQWVPICVTNGFLDFCLCYQRFSGCAANGFPSILPTVSGRSAFCS